MYSGDLTVVDGGTAASPKVGSGADDSQTSTTTHSSDSFTSDEYASPAADSHGPALDDALVAEAVALQDAEPFAMPFAEVLTSVTPRDDWHRRYLIQLVALDFGAASIAVVLAFLARMLMPSLQEAYGSKGGVDVAFGMILPVVWVAVIALNHAYQSRIVGVGSIEFQRIFRAFFHITALIAFAAYVTRADIARGFILAALPLTLALDLVGRYAARKHLHRQRGYGRSMTSVVAVGGASSVAEFTAMLRRDRYAGMRVIGACVPSESDIDAQAVQILEELGVPVLGDVDSVLEAVRFSGAHTLAVLSGEISADKLRWISWQLEGTETDLVVSPGLTEVAGNRLHIQPVAGLPMVYVEEPEFTGFRRFLKSAFDRTAAALAILALSPIIVTLGLAVRLTSRGPAFFRQVRVGLDGSTFTMIKFRSMYVNAESRLAELQTHNVNADGLLFKIKDDPRVTRLGRILRRYSLDELPQLFNVFKGEMSLVGPRPPLPAEVAQYGTDVRRRLLVKPGITGMWQISGRSDLAWDESVRLDLRYVENWSLATDLFILCKTVGAVVRSSGAY